MFGSKEYTGIVLEGDVLKIARIVSADDKLHLIKLDSVSLVEDVESKSRKDQEVFEDSESFEEGDDIFGLEEEGDEGEDISLELDEELSFEDLEEEEEIGEEGDVALDMVEEAESAPSNEMVLYNVLADSGANRANVGLNIPAGNTIFQIIRDTNFKNVKNKDLVADLEQKLESIYGTPKSSDNYAYEIKEDGSLILASIDEEPTLLTMINRSMNYYSGKLMIEEIMSDEALLVGLVRANYPLQKNEITGILQFGPRKCRIVFMQGKEIWLISPIINEGTRDKGFLNTVFSKILFQLDTGEVPNLDRLILANNTIGDEATDFFQKNFPDIDVEEFQFASRKLSIEDYENRTVSGFTTAIGAAWAASKYEYKKFPQLSLIPGYVHDRQKIFKLQWHGVILLFLIGLMPIVFNYFYQQNSRTINNLEAEIGRIDAQITELTPTVNSANQIKEDLSLLRQKLVLLDTLSSESKAWTEKLRILNQGMRQVGSSWITTMRFTEDGLFFEGYTLYRNRVPRIVNIFADATLMNVSIDEIREQEVFRFVILVKEFARDKSIYSPEKPDALKQVLSN